MQDTNYVWKETLKWDKEVSDKLTEMLKNDKAFPDINITLLIENSKNEIDRFLTSSFKNNTNFKSFNKAKMENYYTTKLDAILDKKSIHCPEEYVEALILDFKKSITSLPSGSTSKCTIV